MPHFGHPDDPASKTHIAGGLTRSLHGANAEKADLCTDMEGSHTEVPEMRRDKHGVCRLLHDDN